ncbi:MAG: iron-containing redox enzyme family protein [Rhodanobacteraceae bacterium]
MSAQLSPTTGFAEDGHALHTRLASFNAIRLKPGVVTSRWQEEIGDEFASRLEEGRFLEQERTDVASWLSDMPTDPDAYMIWFEALAERGPGQNDVLFPWLATTADLKQMRWFLTQEIAGEAGFDDLVALTQVRLPVRPKLEMAANYWDEMGRGHEKGMHGGMLEHTAEELQLTPRVRSTVWESLAVANLMAGLAANRRYTYQSVGALGAIEMTAPGRVSLVNEGLRRLGVSIRGRQYFQLHAGLDVRHSEAWNREVIRPLIRDDVRIARAIAEGALMRLRAGERCFQRYRAELGFSRTTACSASSK